MKDLISTLCHSLDILLDGGIERKTITQIYGEFATGKSVFCMQIAKSVLLAGKKVAYIDTESGLSIIRIKQILDTRFDELIDNMMILEPDTFETQHNSIQELKKLIDERFDLIIIDSIASLYRLESNTRDERILMGKELAKQLAILTGISKLKNLAVIVTNQVYEDIETNKLEPIGGSTIKYWSKNIIELSKSKDSTKRVAKLIRHRFLPPNRTAEFRITDKGIEDLG